MRHLFALLLLMATAPLFAQDTSYTATKEKIYVQTNHVFFKPGETLFFKLYVVKAKDQTPSWRSPVVYTEIINPAGNVVRKMNYRVTDGYAEGSYEFAAEANGGVYKIRAYTTWMRNEQDSSFFVKEVTVQKVITPRILMKLDFPEKGYGAGSEVSADFSMRNLGDEPIRFYPAKFSVSIGGKVIETESVRTNQEGKAKVRFVLPRDLSTTDGLLNLTVSYDSYTEAISRSIPIVLNHIDLQLMPEGGTLVQGLSSVVAFRAVNEQGKPVDVKGFVYNRSGAVVATLESYHSGMGRFMLTPAADQEYYVKVTSPANIHEVYALPPAQYGGVVMHVSKASGTIQVELNSTGRQDVRVVTEAKGQLQEQRVVTLSPGSNELLFDEARFPMGIARITVFTSDLRPLAERLIFLNEGSSLRVRITPDKKRYLPREAVHLHIETTDARGLPVPANLSLSVVDDQLWSFADDKQDHILSWLLLSSELHGKIDEPQFYFRKDEPKAVPALDLVMLTHGYRYFDYIAGAGPDFMRFTPEERQVIGGIIQNRSGRPLAATVFLLLPGREHKVVQSRTDTSGVFFFSGLIPNEAYYLMAQADDRKEQTQINITQKELGYNPLRGREPRALSPRKDDLMAVLGRPLARPDAERQKAMDPIGAFTPNTHAALSEVVVVGYGGMLRRDLSFSVVRVGAKELEAMNRIPMALQGRISGLTVYEGVNELDRTRFKVRGIRSLMANEPQFVIDGVLVEQLNLNTLNAQDIESITVLKDATAAAIYGSRGANGVVLIETKKYSREKIQLRLSRPYSFASQMVRLNGVASYSAVRRFYAPKYSQTDVDEKTDFRSNIYWNPVVQTDGEGKADLTYYNSDASTTFRVIAEGIGYQGLAGREEQTYSVKNALGVDAKIPPYLTVGDRALLPLVVRNNRAVAVSLSLSVLVPKGMQVGAYPSTIDVPADSSVLVSVPVMATEAVNGTISFVVEGHERRQTINLPITAADKGFPVSITCSGNRAHTHTFELAQPLEGSVQAKIRIFRDLEGQLLDGIESMLHEPYGCFEQTSSSTYPNIYVLKYLKESGRLNPEVEKKAMTYIQNGYKRLLGFETPQNGFEWFGHTPPHEALTAYGLLEFTDMQEFIPVDRQMLERTKKFLLDRRDGQGSFKIAAGGYDRFAAVPGKIANLYIVYALTQAGVGREIEREYRAAVAKALESRDGYQLGLMALAASNMKEGKDFQLLMKELNKQYTATQLTSETSVVNSRETSLRVETLSLYALALLREPAPDMVSVASIISQILSTKTYYGYGATQATVLALQAIVTYSKARGRIAENAGIDLELNGQPLKEEASSQLKKGTNVFTVGYADPEKAIPYSFEVTYHTLTPPASEKAELKLSTSLSATEVRVGETVRMEVSVANARQELQPMAVAKIGIPAGTSVQPWQLKELMERNEVAYYEIFDNYLVFYWMGFAPGETKTIRLDLKAEIAGTYTAKASNAYLYYTPEFRHWNEGVSVTVR